MLMHRVPLALGISVSVIVAASSMARANPEAPGMYDAQSQAMGGTGTAYLTTPAAIVHNPANLDLAPDLQLGLSITMMAVQLETSFAGAGNEQKSPLIAVPLAFLGGSVRVSDRVTIGGAAYISMGFGGSFTDVRQYGTGTPCIGGIGDVVRLGNPLLGESLLELNSDAQNADYCPSQPRDESVTLVIVEAAIPVAVRVLDNLRVGVSLRFPYGVLQQTTSQDIFGALTDQPTGNFGLGYAQVSSSMSGFGTPGILLGATYDPIPEFTLAFAYRSKIKVHLEGTTNMDLRSNELIGGLLDVAGGLPIGALSGLIPGLGIQNGDTVDSFVDDLTGAIPSSANWYMPHALELATAVHLLDRRLLLAAELRMQFHREANKALTVMLDDPRLASLGFTSFTQRFDWKNVYGINLGAQFMATERLALRAGYNSAVSSIPPHTVGQFTPPPGFQYSLSTGAGYALGSFQLDFAATYAAGRPFRIEQQHDENGAMIYEPTCQPGMTIKSGCPGSYGVASWFLGLGITYRPGSSEPASVGIESDRGLGGPEVHRLRAGEAG